MKPPVRVTVHVERDPGGTMSDTEPWASPSQEPSSGGGAQQPPPPGAAAQPPRAPQVPPLGPLGGGAPYGGPPGWTPPPKPGLVPLRPLTLGDILSGAFGVFRRNPRTTFGTSVLFQILSLILLLVVAGGAALFAFDRYQSALPSQRESLLAGSILGVVAAALVPVVVQIAITAILQGLFVVETSHQVVGERMRLRGLLGQARGRIGALVGWSFLLIAAWILGLALLAGAVALLAVAGGTVSTVAAVLLAVFGALGAFAVAAWFGTKTVFVPSILMLERTTIRTAVARSWRLTRQSFWRTFGIVALVAVIISVANGVVNVPVSILGQIGGGLVRPNGELNSDGLPSYIVVNVVGQFVSLVIASIGAVIQSATVALLYIDQRMRREALDLDLARYAELRAQGVRPLPDPYRTPDRAVPGSGPAPWAGQTAP
jgi:hypothetical protein